MSPFTLHIKKLTLEKGQSIKGLRKHLPLGKKIFLNVKFPFSTTVLSVCLEIH